MIDMYLFPRQDYRQDVINIDTISEPETDLLRKEQDYIRYMWKNPKVKLFKFGFESNIRTENSFKKIDKKIDFPVLKLDPEYYAYLEPTEFIDITPEIRRKANDIVSGEDDLFEAVFKLADWTRNNVKYDLNTLTAQAVQKSSWVFQNRDGVCDEITNLFISFLRSIGIPARFISGTVYSNLISDFGNHGWAEVYFPGYDWVPFDVTFGQYGWLDATHLKLKDSYDSGENSAKYSWKSRDLDIKVGELNIKTEITGKGDKIEKHLLLNIEPLKKEAGFGSYVPIQVTVENLESYYVSSSLYITKASGLIDKSSKEILLKPKEIKSFYWITKVPEDLNEDYIYTSTLEVQDSFGDEATSLIKYAKQYEVYTSKKANETLENLNKREEKAILPNLDAECTSDKDFYYPNESIIINCKLKNDGNINLENLQACLKETCYKVDLSITETKNISFVLNLKKTEKLEVAIENKDMIKYAYISTTIIQIPDVYITDLNPKEVNYKDFVNLSFILNSETEVRELKIELRKLGSLSIDRLKGSQRIDIQLKGSDFLNELHFIIKYKDEKGKLYTKEEKLLVKVNNISWYGRIVKLFRKFV